MIGVLLVLWAVCGFAFRARQRLRSSSGFARASVIGALVGAGIGIGHVFGSYLSGALRNPGAAASQTTNLLLGFALCEATGLFGLVIALIILFT